MPFVNKKPKVSRLFHLQGGRKLQRYLPKGSDFSKISQEELDDIIWEINNRPRKVLNYNTPKEVFKLYLKRESCDSS